MRSATARRRRSTSSQLSPKAPSTRAATRTAGTPASTLAHITAIEWTYPKLIDVAKSPPAPKAEDKPKEAKPPTRTAGGGINSYNDRSIARYDGVSAKDLIEEFRKNRATTISTIDAEDDETFLMPVKSAGGVSGPLGYVMNLVAVMHVGQHVSDIVTGTAQQ